MTNENDWVTQDVVPDRNGFDQWRWVSPGNPNPMWNNSIEDTHVKHGQVEFESRAEVRCRRKDLPLGIGSASKNPLPCSYCTATAFKGWCEGKCPYCGLCQTVAVIPEIGFNEDDELNAAPRTRAWTFGTPAQTGHFLISFLDPAVTQKDITACTIDKDDDDKPIWFVYLGQTSDFVDPVVPKAKYTLLTDPKEPNGAWLRRPDEIQDALNRGWLLVAEREFEVPEWD